MSANPATKPAKIKPMTMAALMANLRSLPDINSSDSSEDSSSPSLPVRARDQTVPKSYYKENTDRTYYQGVHIMPTINDSSACTQPGATVENVANRPPLLEKNVSSDSSQRSSPYNGLSKSLLPVRALEHTYTYPKTDNKENKGCDRSHIEPVPIMPTKDDPSKSSQATTATENIANRLSCEKRDAARCLFPEPRKEPEPKDTPHQTTIPKSYPLKEVPVEPSCSTTVQPPLTASAEPSCSTSVQQIPTISTEPSGSMSIAQTPTVSANPSCHTTVQQTPTISSTPALPQSKSKIQFKSISIKGRKYLYLKKLGEGGSSLVYKMLDINTSNEFALKTVNLTADREMSRGYLNEVRVLRELQKSDRVVKLYEFDYDRSLNILNLVLEVGETDLACFLQRHRGGAPPPLVLYYWGEMLRAVQQIHDHGIVHADLKPANFLLVSGTLKLIDFGIASKVSSDATSVERSCGKGTFSYISPEALGGDGSQPIKVSFYSDVWSLGCILYSLVYGQTPFAHLVAVAKLVTIRDPNHRIEYPRADNIPPALLATMKQCLRYNGHHRPKVAEMLQVNYMPRTRGIPDDILIKVLPHLTPQEFQILQNASVSGET